MVISHKYKYVFVELPRTGTTAISNELCNNYDGNTILTKHSTYEHFLKTVSEEEKNYFVFSCIRNPLDRTLSLYTKLKNKDESYYKDLSSNKSKVISNNHFIKRMRYIKKHNLNFEGFLKKYYFWPYSDWSILSHKKFDAVIKFENIQDDFSQVLKELQIEQVGQIPIINKTESKKNNLTDYLNNNKSKSKDTFLPFMLFWDYEVPPEWGVSRVSTGVQIKYQLINSIRKIYWKYIK